MIIKQLHSFVLALGKLQQIFFGSEMIFEKRGIKFINCG